MAQFRQGSRYTNGAFTLNAGKKEFLLLREQLTIPESANDIFLTIDGRFTKRIDLISQQVYGRPDLGWVILDINNIKQSLFELQTGQVLRIPPLAVVLEAIDKINRGL